MLVNKVTFFLSPIRKNSTVTIERSKKVMEKIPMTELEMFETGSRRKKTLYSFKIAEENNSATKPEKN